MKQNKLKFIIIDNLKTLIYALLIAILLRFERVKGASVAITPITVLLEILSKISVLLIEDGSLFALKTLS